MLRPESWMFSVDSMAVRMGPGVRGRYGAEAGVEEELRGVAGSGAL